VLKDQWGEWTFLAIVLFSIAATVILFVGTATLAAILARAACSNTGEILGIDCQWRFLGGCFVEITEGRWVPLERYWHITK